jgi:FdhE protein
MTAAVEGLKQRRPEWTAWLNVIDDVQREIASSRWDRAVPEKLTAGGASAPLLAGARLAIDSADVRRFLERLMTSASRVGTPAMTTLGPARVDDLDAVSLFKASAAQASDYGEAIPAGAAVDLDALRAVAAFLPVPFLHACNRRHARAIPPGWVNGYCPLCGSWPAFAEVRGIDRSRYLRCGRCGGEWRGHMLRCVYCRTTDHERLASLVPEKPGQAGTIEACRQCLGYVKVFTTLQGDAPATVMLHDLATVDLDVAAIGQGYVRPAGAGYPLELSFETRFAGAS